MKMVMITVKAFLIVEMMKVVNKDTESGGVMKDGCLVITQKKIVLSKSKGATYLLILGMRNISKICQLVILEIIKR